MVILLLLVWYMKSFVALKRKKEKKEYKIILQCLLRKSNSLLAGLVSEVLPYFNLKKVQNNVVTCKTC